MSAIQNPAIQSIISREITDKSGLKESTQQYKQKILTNLGIKQDSGLFSNIKNYLINILHKK